MLRMRKATTNTPASWWTPSPLPIRLKPLSRCRPTTPLIEPYSRIHREEYFVSNYATTADQAGAVIAKNGPSWNAISPEYVARMRLQNRFTTGLDIARYTAKIMREDM